MKLIIFLILGLFATGNFPVSAQMIKFQKEMRRNHPSPSPDNKNIVFHVNQANGKTGLYISDWNGQNERVLFSKNNFNAQEPRWSPDGKWIAFVGGSNYESNNFALYIIKPDGSEIKEVHRPKIALAKSPFWSADSKKLLYAERNRKAGWSRVHAIDINGHNHRLLNLKGEGFHYQPRWGQKTNRILITWWSATKSEVGDLYIFNPLKPNEKEWVTRTKSLEGMPAWSPDERFIIFYKDIEGVSDLFGIDLKTKEEFRVTKTKDAQEYFPTFSRDGKYLLFQTVKQDPKDSTKFYSSIYIQSFCKILKNQ